jgi:spermidine synthase
MAKIPNWKNALSYFWPLHIERRSSALNRMLNVDLFKGKLILNTQNANYSFGRLHYVMAKSLTHAKSMGCNFGCVLILGHGGGSAAQLIHSQFNSNSKITAVEIDPIVIEVAHKWFYTQHVNLILKDAFDFVKTDLGRYDLIICDVFRDIYTPDVARSIEFYKDCHALLLEHGVFMQNLLLTESEVEIQAKKVGSVFNDIYQIQMYRSNTIYLGLK